MDFKKTFSKLGIAMFAFLTISSILSVILAILLEMTSPGVLQNGEVQSLISFVSIDLFGFAIFWLIVKKCRVILLIEKK